MKSTGIVRHVDKLGRIVVPKEIRDVLGVKEESSMEIFVSDDKVLLRKYEPGCTFCGDEDVFMFKGKLVCSTCSSDLGKIK